MTIGQEQNSQEPAVIVKNDGTAYATSNAAKSGMTGRGLSANEYEVRPMKDGFGIFKIGQANPPATPSQGIQPPSPSVDDQIAKKQAELDALEDQKAKQNAPKPIIEVPEKYYRVRFQPAGNPEDETDVMLSVNAAPLVIPRDVETIIPERYKVAADNTLTPKYRQKPGESRKLIGEILKFPYILLGEATKAEYLALKASGDKKTQEFVEQQRREGMDKK